MGILKKIGKKFKKFSSSGAYAAMIPGGYLSERSGFGLDTALSVLSPALGERMFGEEPGPDHSLQIARENMAMQKEFAQNGIRWKMEDAKQAGIHPVFALGASGASFSPVSYTPAEPDRGDAHAMAEMGQHIGRAIQNTRSTEEQEIAKLQLANARADLQGKVIDNQIRASELRRLQQTGPGLPSAGGTAITGGQRNAVKVNPSEVIASQDSGSPFQAGMINTVQYTREANGNIGIAPSKDMKERIEDDFIAETGWHLKNRISPPAPSTRDYPLPDWAVKKGMKYWFWHPFKQEFIPSKNP